MSFSMHPTMTKYISIMGLGNNQAAGGGGGNNGQSWWEQILGAGTKIGEQWVSRPSAPALPPTPYYPPSTSVTPQPATPFIIQSGMNISQLLPIVLIVGILGIGAILLLKH